MLHLFSDTFRLKRQAQKSDVLFAPAHLFDGTKRNRGMYNVYIYIYMLHLYVQKTLEVFRNRGPSGPGAMNSGSKALGEPCPVLRIKPLKVSHF